MSKRQVTLKINGKNYNVMVQPWQNLTSAIRNEAGLTGTKESCGNGECGACSIILDGTLVNSCITLAAEADGKEIQTVEGLARDGQLHPLQEAFMACGAVQCGYCSPGFLMTAKHFLDKNPNPTVNDIRQGLSQNICRCTGYVKIIDAILYAADTMRGIRRESRLAKPNGHIVGTSVPRLDIMNKVIGKAKYAADFKMEGMLHAKILRSPHHHANIVGIDTSQALALPGVKAVVTYDDILARKDMLTGRPQPFLLAKDKVRFMGEAVAAVAATSPEIAEEALSKIKVHYEPLAVVFDPIKAMQDGAPKLYPPFNNFIKVAEVVRGDVERAFAQADAVVEGTFDTPPWEHAAMEREAGLAYVDKDGCVTLHVALHHTFPGRDWLAAMLGVEKEQVRLISEAMGGCFGMRGDFIHAGIISLLAVKTKKPVKIEYTRG